MLCPYKSFNLIPMKKKEQNMKLPEYVTAKEVARVCKEAGLADWSKRKKAVVSVKEAAKILKIVNVEKMKIPLDDFRMGLEVELEHGTRFQDANITNNHPLLTGKIVLAHLKETMDYYRRIDVAEIEGDLLKAILSGNLVKIKSKYKKLAQAKKILSDVVARQLT
jgi:glycine cleavage system aminomethyltransferase T